MPKHCLTMRLYLEQYANVILLYHLAFNLQIKSSANKEQS